MPSDHLASGTLKLIGAALGVHGRTRTLASVRFTESLDRDSLNGPCGSGSGLGLGQRSLGRSALGRSLDDPAVESSHLRARRASVGASAADSSRIL